MKTLAEYESDIVSFIQSGNLKLPGLPDIATRVQQAIQKDDFTISEIARIVQSDIPLTGRLIQIANSPLYSGLVPVERCSQAISRLGVNVTRNLVTSFAIRRLFYSKSSKIRELMAEVWKKSVKIAAIGFTLARITPGLDPDRAMLTALIHEIGVLPILSYAEENPELLKNTELLQQMIRDLRVSFGALILRQWRFDQEFITVVEESENWMRDPGPKPDYCDVILVAKLHAVFGEEQKAGLPKLQDLPAFRKFPIMRFGENASMELLKEAQEEMQELQQLLVSA